MCGKAQGRGGVYGRKCPSGRSLCTGCGLGGSCTTAPITVFFIHERTSHTLTMSPGGSNKGVCSIIFTNRQGSICEKQGTRSHGKKKNSITHWTEFSFRQKVFMIIEQGTEIMVCLGLSNLCNVKGGEGSQRREAQCVLLRGGKGYFQQTVTNHFSVNIGWLLPIKGPE